MTRDKKEIERRILLEEELGEEKDYDEYARQRYAQEHRNDPAARGRSAETGRAEQNKKPAGGGAGRGPAGNNVPDTDTEAPAKLKSRKRHPVLRVLAILLVLILAAGGGIMLYLRSLMETVSSVQLADSLQSSISEQVRSDEAMSGYRNIALFGVDSREQDLASGNNRSDSIMICSINNKTGEVKLVSVYRDTLLDIGGGEYRKANAAYAFGGPQQAIAMLNTNLDLNITDFITVGFEGLADVIDALGGIDLEITDEEAEYMNSYMDDMYYEIGTEYDEVDGGGMKHLSGIQATAYCRIRYTVGDDFKRAERQRTVLSLTMQKAREANPIQLISVANSVLGEVATSMGTMDLFSFILRARAMDLGESTGIPTDEDRTFATVNGESCVIPYYLNTNVRKLHETLFGEEGYEPSEAVQERDEQIRALSGY